MNRKHFHKVKQANLTNKDIPKKKKFRRNTQHFCKNPARVVFIVKEIL